MFDFVGARDLGIINFLELKISLDPITYYIPNSKRESSMVGLSSIHMSI